VQTHAHRQWLKWATPKPTQEQQIKSAQQSHEHQYSQQAVDEDA
jgi:hypothetical protein